MMHRNTAWLGMALKSSPGWKSSISPSDTVSRQWSHSQIASVGLTQEQASKKGHEILIGRASYSDVVMGDAMAEKEGFAKAVVEKKSEKILGFHIAGPEAAILIQEVANAMARGGDVKSITENMHVFPALSEVVPEALKNLE